MQEIVFVFIITYHLHLVKLSFNLLNLIAKEKDNASFTLQ